MLVRLLALACLLGVPATVHAKDLRKRIGAGFETQSDSVPALSVRYCAPSPNAAINIQAQLNVGVDTRTDSQLVGGKVLYALVAEDNMNLSAVGGLASITDSGDNFMRVHAGFSIDAFFFGLENLGITSMVGINADSGDSSGTSTGATIGGGVHYWF